MLFPILGSPFWVEVRSQEILWVLGIGCVPRDGVQFVIAHHGEGSARIDHAAHDVHRADLSWTAIDKVSDEDRLSSRVAPGTGGVAIAKLAEQCLQLVRLPVDVPDDVVTDSCQICGPPLRRGCLPLWRFRAPAGPAGNALT